MTMFMKILKSPFSFQHIDSEMVQNFTKERFFERAVLVEIYKNLPYKTHSLILDEIISNKRKKNLRPLLSSFHVITIKHCP